MRLDRRSLLLLAAVALSSACLSPETAASAPDVATGDATDWTTRLEAHLPDALTRFHIWHLAGWEWVALILGGIVALGLGLLLERLLLGVGGRVTRFTRFTWDDRLVLAAKGPLKLLFFSGLLAILTRALVLHPVAQAAIDIVARSLVILCVAWFLLRFVRFIAEFIKTTVVADAGADPGRVRGLHTQVTVLRHVLEVAVFVIACALVLMQFEVVRSVGVSLLASAGIAGVVIGLAAQKSIGTLLAGIQLSITQPIRIGDTVIVENEWGWVEEVRLTYVVVKVWDLRRLVVPITYFLDRPFQNWSKVAPEILGTVELRADFTTDVEVVRAELKRILEEEGKALWDGKAQGIQVTDCTDRVMTLRALISASDAGKAWDLRCLVREKLIALLTRNPGWLPVTRNETRVQSADGKTNAMAPFTPPNREARPA